MWEKIPENNLLMNVFETKKVVVAMTAVTIEPKTMSAYALKLLHMIISYKNLINREKISIIFQNEFLIIVII